MGTIANRRPVLTPKAIIFQKFGEKAVYTVEEVHELSGNGCPGLSIVQKGPCLYRCCLQLPDFSITSETFRRKKDAEQAAAQKAIEKLEINLKEDGPTSEEAWDDLVSRLSYLFSKEFLLSVHPFSGSLHPLGGHFRMALKREGRFSGCVPVSVIASYDSKISSLCRCINPEVEVNPLMSLSIVLRAATRLGCVACPSTEQLSLKRRIPYPVDVLEPLAKCESSIPGTVHIKAIRIPASKEKTVESLRLDVCAGGYYLDVIAQELDATEASRVLLSRTIGKASSELRLYFRSPQSYELDSAKDVVDCAAQIEGLLNVRGSYLAGQRVYGDALLASIGYTWRSTDLFYEDLSLCSYYRFLLNKTPSGVYKLSREALLAAELPLVYTSRSYWRGSYPRDMLYTFCRQHHLSEPLFSLESDSSETSTDSDRRYGTDKITGPIEKEKLKSGNGSIGGESGPTGPFKCGIKILSRRMDFLLQCLPKMTYKNQTDAIQNVSLKILSWLNMFFRNPDVSSERLRSLAEELELQIHPENLLKEFSFSLYVPNRYLYESTDVSRTEVSSASIEGADSGVYPFSGSLVSVHYSVSLVVDEECIKKHVESNEEFEFEMGTGAVFPYFEAIVSQMSVDQTASFHVDLPSKEFLLAADHDASTTQSLLSSRKCNLEYYITLLNVLEPLEDRMEKALFSPSLSKQRVEYAVRHICQSSALSLVDFGCGSGSLLDSLLEFRTSLEKIVGVDISQRSLTRAAKILHLKLNKNPDLELPCKGIKFASLYEGSIISYDSRLCNFDIATCLEVIEHMQEADASLFGDVVLGSFCPKILILSTPNYEYNSILQKSSTESQEADPDEKNQLQSCKFRNHDHKFEWTRKQFSDWATDLATRHDYSVEFSGVGGVADVEPGFASQIAVFRRRKIENQQSLGLANDYKVIWEWNVDNRSNHAL